jgi:hypothetical protein
MTQPIRDAERCAIMERIRERCNTSVSARAECAGRALPFIVILPYPYTDTGASATFSWEAAKRISLTGGRFNLA